MVQPNRPEQIKLEQSIAALQRITDPRERKAFYDSHPELAAIYSPVNFPTLP